MQPVLRTLLRMDLKVAWLDSLGWSDQVIPPRLGIAPFVDMGRKDNKLMSNKHVYRDFERRLFIL